MEDSMQIPVALKSRFFRRTPRIPSDRGSVALNIMIGMIVMMLVTYELAKTLSPALHTISAREDVKQSGTISDLANSYVAQTGDMQPTIAKLVANGYLSGTAKGVCASCTGMGTLTTNDGSVISLGPGSVGGVYSMTLQPGPNMNLDDNYYLSHLTGSTLNGTLIQWNQPVPAIDNLGTYFVQKNPANPSATQTVNSPLSTNGYPLSAGPINSSSLNTGTISSGQINTNGQSIYTGSLTTSGPNPINLTGNHGVCVTISQPPGEGQTTFGSYPIYPCLPMGQMIWPFGYNQNASFEWTGIIVNGQAEVLQNQGYNNNCGGCDWFYTGFIILAPVYSYW